MTKRKIGLVELYDHSEVLLTMFRLLEMDFEVTVFTTQKIKKDAEDFFGKKLEKWISKPTENSKEEFVKTHFPKFNNQDILIFITLVDAYRFFSKIKFQPKTIIVIHNVNTLLQPQKNRWFDSSSLKNYSMDVLRYFRNTIRRDNFYKKKLLQNFDYISFPSEQMTSYAKGLETDFSNKIIDPIPFSFFEKRTPRELENASIIISVPGVVLEHVRDYEMLFDAFSELVPRLQRKVKLQLLGSAYRKYAQLLIHKFQALENDKFELVYFEKPLSQNDFDDNLEKTDFAILPIKKFKKFGIIREEYGVSNISGGVNDVLRFGIPTLLVGHYPIDKIDESIISHYHSKRELLEKVEEWINHSEYRLIRERSIPFLEEKSEQKRRVKVIKMLDKLQ